MSKICIAYIISTIGGNQTINYSYNTIDDATGNITASNVHDKFVITSDNTEAINAINTITNIINTKLNPITIPVNGSITIKYQDSNGNDLESPTIMSELALATYVFNAKPFNGYNLVDSSTKTAILDSNNLNIVLIFKYESIISGQITIKYQDSNGNDLESPTILNGLNMGNYTYNNKIFDGYTLSSNSSQTVQLTNTNPIASITFTYVQNPA